MKLLAALVILLLAVLPLRAETPWGVAEVLRSETGRIERLLYRAQTPARDAEIAGRLDHMAAAWHAIAGAFDPAGAATVDAALAAYVNSAARGDAHAAARQSRQLWAALLIAARAELLAAIDRAEAGSANNWLTIRDYARASGDTAAALAVQALGEGTVSPVDARASVDAELLGVAASELRLALTRAAEDAVSGHTIQYAGQLGRADGLVAYLAENLSERLGSETVAAINADLVRAETDPTAVAVLLARLEGYAPVAISANERLRRANLLRRFTALIWEEYRDGVRDGEIRQAMEYNEAQLFHDRAAMIFGDLALQVDDRVAAARLATVLAQIKVLMDARADGVEPLVAEALSLIDDSFGADVTAGGVAVAFDALAATLNVLGLMAQAGDWAGAEMKRLEAYSWFDPDIEQRLVPRAPAMALRLEARFWEGTAAHPGLGTLISRQTGGAPLQTEIAAIANDLTEARSRINAPSSALGSLLQSGGIVFREGLEAVLILAALLAALRAEGTMITRLRPAIAAGVVLALLGSVMLWAAARWLFSISTLAREALEGGTALVAAAVLVWLVLGLSGHGGHVAAFRARLAGVAQPATVALLAFLVVFREGFETVLFYEALMVDAAPGPVLGGLALGGAAALAAGWAVLASGRWLPLGLFFRATSILLAVLAVMLVGAGVRGLQTADLISATPVAWFPDADWLQLWFAVLPVAEPLAAQALVFILLLAGSPLRRAISGLGRKVPAVGR